LVQEKTPIIFGKYNQRLLLETRTASSDPEEVLPSTEPPVINAQADGIQWHQDSLVCPGVNKERNTTSDIQPWEDHLGFDVRPTAGVPESPTEHR
jgi:hypothetical protein